MIRKLRLATGLILFAYITLHFTNHMAGLWSLAAMNAAKEILHAPWYTPVGATVLYGALAIHACLALYAIYQRRRLKIPFEEGLQLFLGLAVPFLLVGHVLGTRGAFTMFGANVDYVSVLAALWHVDPLNGVRQITVFFAAWIHGCLGIYRWLHLKPWYRDWQPVFFALALLIPALSLTGFMQGAKAVVALASDPAWFAQLQVRAKWPSAENYQQLVQMKNYFTAGFLLLLVSAFALRYVRAAIERWRGIVRLTYDDGYSIQFPPGRSILEASLATNIPHASVCGGRGRCSTCRVRVTRGIEHLPPASSAEQKVLDRVNAGIQVRLACQARPTGGDVDVIRLLPTTARAEDGHRRPEYLQGQEREIAILFADIRAFTKLSEKKLPYDVVFLLNRYFDAMGSAVKDCGGHLDKFIGDGVMALFGIEDGPEAGSRAALAAARQMGLRIAELNRALAGDLDEPLRIGIGIHCGPAIVGAMGFGDTVSVTAIGDSVNIASRLETQTKDFHAELVVSRTTVQQSGLDLSSFEIQDVAIRGRTEPLSVHVVRTARDLPEQAPIKRNGRRERLK
ncbi:MAG: 2Fe-2S iron-sulfur cluster binding domain-containing protein [Alphaproteobacteria bacterium]|nr:2Fe-2S iron-sulfur cluster binding domain-containing protein [Alphaproteobacteria bacterium]